MQVDITLKNAKVYDFDRADILKGESFSLDTDGDDNQIWASTNDPVLTINGSGKHVDISADKAGVSYVFIMDSGFNIEKTLTITVVETMDKAASLGITSDQPQDK